MTKTSDTGGGGATQALERSAAVADAQMVPAGQAAAQGEDFSETSQRLKGAARDVEPKKRKGGTTRGGQDFYFDYFTADQVMDLLDEEAGSWSFTLKPLMVVQQGDQLCVTAIGSMTINGVTREGVGTGLVRKDCPLETAIKKADSDSLKRAALKFGIGIARIKAEAAVSYAAEGRAVDRPGQRAQRANPRAENDADKLTHPQKLRIAELSKALGHDRDWVEQQVGCKAEDMSKAAASSLINVMERELEARQQTAGA